MKIYVFDTINGVVIRKAANSMDEAIAWFKETYPTRAFSCVYEQQTQEKIKKVLTNNQLDVIIIIESEREVMIMRIDVAITCPFCGEDHAVEVNLAQYEAWQNGELIQNAMPDLTPTEREQLISGLCPKCQAKMFGD